jgi:hypothetical protein
MSELGHFRKSAYVTRMSVLPLEADIVRLHAQVRSVPEADMAMGLFDHLVGASKNARRG